MPSIGCRNSVLELHGSNRRRRISYSNTTSTFDVTGRTRRRFATGDGPVLLEEDSRNDPCAGSGTWRGAAQYVAVVRLSPAPDDTLALDGGGGADSPAV